MRNLLLSTLAALTLLTGCASTDFAARPGAAREESYVGLGSNIPKKGARRAEDQTIDLQQLDNARTMGSATLTGAPVK